MNVGERPVYMSATLVMLLVGEVFRRVKDDWYRAHPDVMRRDPIGTECMRCGDTSSVHFGDDMKAFTLCWLFVHEVEEELHCCRNCDHDGPGPYYAQRNQPDAMFCTECVRDQALEEVTVVDGIAILIAIDRLPLVGNQA